MIDTIQEGIFYRSGERPPPAFRLLLLNATQDSTRTEFTEAISTIHTMTTNLRSGRVAELENQPKEHQAETRAQFADLRTTIGFGRRLFDSSVHDHLLTSSERPAYLSYLDGEMPFPSLAWDSHTRDGECDIALQFTAHSMAAVNCAAVEVWKLIQDGLLPLVAMTTYDGFARLDRRGWLEFHDGVSNMDSAVRAEAITARTPKWMDGGSYMAFLRIPVDLPAWRGMGRRRQELAVGRDKLAGAALERVRVNDDGQLVADARPFDPDDRSAAADWRDPSQRPDLHLERSHIHRANQSRASPHAPGSFRLFRQGYEFLDDVGPNGPRLGLNFVSFQRDIRVLQHLMHAPGWLGDSNFGGDAPADALTLEAGGFYAVPPREDPFPGHGLLVPAEYRG